MPIVVIHGDNNSFVSQKVLEMKKSYPKDAIERISLKEESFEQLLIRLATPSFFVDQRLLIVDDIDEKKIVVDKLTVDSSITLVLLFTKELLPSSPVLKWAEQHKFRVVGSAQPQDKRIFTFLDLIAEKNSKALSLIDELTADFGNVYLITMLYFLLRRLVLPIGKVPSFVEEKMKKQKKNFKEEELTYLYKKTLEFEFGLKTGKGNEQTGLLLLLDQYLKK